MTKNVMIVDDAVFMRTILRKMLENAGYKIVAEAEDGKKSIDKYKELYYTDQKVDVVLMDITMPEMDGITALKKIREFDKEANIVMCSSLTSQQSVMKALKLGAKRFIAKPFVEDKVIATIQKVLEN